MKFLRLSPFPHRQKHSGAKSILYVRYFARTKMQSLSREDRSRLGKEGENPSLLCFGFRSSQGRERRETQTSTQNNLVMALAPAAASVVVLRRRRMCRRRRRRRRRGEDFVCPPDDRRINTRKGEGED